MATEIGKDTKVKLSLETIISLGVVLVTMTGMWFTLQADIAEAKELPLAPDPEDVKEIKVTLEKIEDKLYK